MQTEKDRNTDALSEDQAIAEMAQETVQYSCEDLTCEDALSLMGEENETVAQRGYKTDIPNKKEVNRVLSIIEKTEVLMGDFFKTLAIADNKFNAVAEVFFKQANTIANSVKHPTEEDKISVMLSLTAGVVVKGTGALWQSFQTELQFREVIKIFVQEASEKMEYLDMLKGWLDTAVDISFERLCKSSDVESAIANLHIFRELFFSYKLSNYLYSVYEASLAGNFTQLSYPTMFDVNSSLISNLANIETKDTEAEQMTANRTALSQVANRIIAVTKGEIETPELIDVLIASDDKLMATAVNMGLPAPDFFEDDEIGCDKNAHFPFEELHMFPESLGFIADFACLKECGNNHLIAEKIETNSALKLILKYVDEFKSNQKQIEDRENLYGVNSWLLAGVSFMLSWTVWDWAWYWALLMGIVMFVVSAKISPRSKISQICRNKAILLEGDLFKRTKKMGGYIEVIDLRRLRRENNKTYIYAIFGGIIGCCAGPIGFICGLAVGSLIGKLLTNYEPEVEHWRKLSIGSGVWVKVWCVILSVTLLLLIFNWLF